MDACGAVQCGDWKYLFLIARVIYGSLFRGPVFLSMLYETERIDFSCVVSGTHIGENLWDAFLVTYASCYLLTNFLVLIFLRLFSCAYFLMHT